MIDLGSIFGDLVAHTTLRAGEALPPARPGVTWLWAANGIFKRGVDAYLDILIRVAPSPPVPGLAELRTHVRFRQLDPRVPDARVPAHILDGALLHARCLKRVEQQYAVILRGERFELVIPPQEAGAMRVRYGCVPGTLVDIHSHHEMRAFFSDTDNRDDLGLSVSAVIGRLNTHRPEIVLRANVYGHRQRLAAADVFMATGQLSERRDLHVAAHA